MTRAFTPDPHVTKVIDIRASRRALIAGSLGNLVEWYEFAIYAYMAPIIAPLFFPSQSSTAAIMSTFLLFALAFFLRPVGALIFGRLTDRIGRGPVLAVIIGLMAAATTCIGLLPTHAQIGMWAPILLTTCRIAQGISAGGEMGGAVSLLVESAPIRRRGLYGSWALVGTTMGYVLGGGVATAISVALSEEALQEWGWRVGFLIAAPLGLVVFYLRTKVDETPHFKHVQAERQPGASTNIAESDNFPRYTVRYLVATVGVIIVYTGIGNIFLVGMPTLLSNSYSMSFHESYFLAMVTGLSTAVAMPIFGALSDRIGRPPVLMAGATSVVILSYPLYLMLSMGFAGGLVALAIAGFLIGIVGGPTPAFLAERFRTRNRATGVSVSYAISVALFGGTAPYVITWLASTTGNPRSPAYYTILCAGLSVLALLSIRGSQRKNHLADLRD
ncbi:MFS transporter [Rhodococcus sp. WS4]|nr:MFS transporter [Rhodococcus sp. WS4]